jgi:hypothetical protein
MSLPNQSDAGWEGCLDIGQYQANIYLLHCVSICVLLGRMIINASDVLGMTLQWTSDSVRRMPSIVRDCVDSLHWRNFKASKDANLFCGARA